MSNNTAATNFAAIIAKFNIVGDDFEVKPFGSGHINDTFLISSKTQTSSHFLLQKINHFVFKDVDSLMNNMRYVTGHLKQKVAETGNPDKEVLTLIECNDGKYYTEDDNGNYWRMTSFLLNTKSYDLVTTAKQARQGGVAFGRFQHMLCDLHPGLIVDTIPDFLNIENRLNNLKLAIQKNSVQRLDGVLSEVDFLLSRAGGMNELLQLGKAGILPLRITHNDTKFNNILLDDNDEIRCVIDLDTVMQGYIAYDFGDAIRSIINTAAEDEQNLAAIQLNIPLFEAFAQGYLSETISFITEQELKSLVKGVLLMPYMQAVRFLTDYLDGDVYYKTSSADHNLQRTRAQMRLLELLELNKEKLNNMVQNEWFNLKNALSGESLIIVG